MSIELTTYIINMPNKTERRERMSNLMQRLGIEDFTFVEPVVPSIADLPEEFRGLPSAYASLNATVTEKIFPMHLARFPSGADETRSAPFLVFEDDAVERLPTSAIRRQVADMVVSLRDVPRWDMVYLEYCMEYCSRGAGAAGGAVPGLQPARLPYCTAAMLYNARAIPRIRQCLYSAAKLIDFSYAQCIPRGDLIAFTAWPPLFAQDAAAGAGDLAHMTPTHVQWWLNLVIRMYPDPNTPAAPGTARLPACWNSRELLGYVRWGNVVLIVLVTVLLLVLLVRLLATRRSSSRRGTRVAARPRR